MIKLIHENTSETIGFDKFWALLNKQPRKKMSLYLYNPNPKTGAFFLCLETEACSMFRRNDEIRLMIGQGRVVFTPKSTLALTIDTNKTLLIKAGNLEITCY